MKSKEILAPLVEVLKCVGGALLAIALIRLLIVPVWTEGYVCGDGAGWGGILVALGDGSGCEIASAMRVFSCVMWGGLGMGLLVAGQAIRNLLIGHD